MTLSLGLVAGYLTSGIAAPELADQRSKAQKLQKEGNWKEALEIWKAVLADPEHGGKAAAGDLESAQQCLANLNLYAQFDGLVESVIEVHADDWRWRRLAISISVRRTTGSSSMASSSVASIAVAGAT